MADNDYIGSYMQRSLDLRLAASDPARQAVVDSIKQDTEAGRDKLASDKDVHVKELVKELRAEQVKDENERVPEYENYLRARIEQIQKQQNAA